MKQSCFILLNVLRNAAHESQIVTHKVTQLFVLSTSSWIKKYSKTLNSRDQAVINYQRFSTYAVSCNNWCVHKISRIDPTDPALLLDCS